MSLILCNLLAILMMCTLVPDQFRNLVGESSRRARDDASAARSVPSGAAHVTRAAGPGPGARARQLCQRALASCGELFRSIRALSSLSALFIVKTVSDGARTGDLSRAGSVARVRELETPARCNMRSKLLSRQLKRLLRRESLPDTTRPYSTP